MWDQENFEQLLASWLITCDQLFDEVEKPEFCKLLNYTHHTAESLKIPSHHAVKRHVIKIGEEEIAATKKMFMVIFLVQSFDKY